MEVVRLSLDSYNFRSGRMSGRDNLLVLYCSLAAAERTS